MFAKLSKEITTAVRCKLIQIILNRKNKKERDLIFFFVSFFEFF